MTDVADTQAGVPKASLDYACHTVLGHSCKHTGNEIPTSIAFPVGTQMGYLTRDPPQILNT